ncbi:MAG TPA: enoyl-CoA hydratase-related protein [Myxococcota bacterium]|nr:enoyl-CoA hydratase-related protein [Myxococcota bacterium]
MDYSRYEPGLRVAVADRILTLTLNRPEKSNANTPVMHADLGRIWDDIAVDPDVDVVILTGAGEKAFSAGGDPGHMQAMIDDENLWRQTVVEARRIVWRLLECDVPIIARVNGAAVGFGATLALACDIVVAVEDARIGDPHVHAGLVAGDGGALFWPPLVGPSRARELLFTGELLTARQAHELGLVNHVVPRAELDAKVQEIARKIRAGASRAIRLTKHLLNLPLRQQAHGLMDFGLANESLSQKTRDHAEAVAAMREKRKPKFEGR